MSFIQMVDEIIEIWMKTFEELRFDESDEALPHLDLKKNKME